MTTNEETDEARRKWWPIRFTLIVLMASACVIPIVWLAVSFPDRADHPDYWTRVAVVVPIAFVLIATAVWMARVLQPPSAPSVPRLPPVSSLSLVMPAVGSVGLILKGIFGWRDRWVVLHIPFAMILSILGGILLLFVGHLTVQQLRMRGGWSRRPSLREALDELFPTVFLVAVLTPERWSNTADIVMVALFVPLMVIYFWERQRPTGPST